jgi:hypothetical protein
MRPDFLRPSESADGRQFIAPQYAADSSFARGPEGACSYVVPREQFLGCLLVEVDHQIVDPSVPAVPIKKVPTKPPDISPDDKPEPVEGRPVVETATPFTLWRSLPDSPEDTFVAWPFQRLYENEMHDNSRTDLNHPYGQQSVVITKDRPAIIYDDGADICSPVLAFDEAGSAVHFHSSAGSTRGGFSALDDEYFSHLPDWIGQGKVTFVMGGLNMSPNDGLDWDDPYNTVDSTIKRVAQQARAIFPDADFIPLISKQSDNQELTHFSIPEKTKMRGLIFVPRYIARDGMNHVYSVTDKDMSAVREVFHWIRNVGRP